MKDEPKPKYFSFPGMREVAIKTIPDKLTIEQLFERVCLKFNVTEEELKSPCRLHVLTEARHFMMYYMNVEMEMYLERIAEIFNRDHTSVIYGRDRIASYLSKFPQYNEIISEIKFDDKRVIRYRDDDIVQPIKKASRPPAVYNNIQSNYLP